jgi:hypothetical protein
MKIQQWVTRLLALSSALAMAGSLHAGTLLKANGVSTDADATKYYNYIDPGNLRSDQAHWRCVNGFPDAGCDPALGNSVNTIVLVKGHKNKSDLGSDVNGPSVAYAGLGFWRRLELVVDKRSGYQGNVAMSTFNFDPGKCCDPANAKSIVNMEYSPGPAGNRITKFYIYNPAGTRVNSTVFDPNPGTAEALFLPNACASCHGGGKDYTVRGGSTGGGWLAFDFNVFDYSVAAEGETQAANEANVKALNKAVLMTNAGDDNSALIQGLYGGRGLPLAAQNMAYRPKSWDTEPKLWTVVVRDCQGCHTWSEVDIRSLNYWKKLDSARNIRALIDTEKTMPNSPTGMNNLLNRDGGSEYAIIDDALTRFGAPHR